MSSSFMQVTPKVFQLKQTPYNIEQNKGEQYKITKDQVNFRRFESKTTDAISPN